MGDPFTVGDPRRCPFVRAVLADDDATIDRLNAADGDPAPPAVVDWLKAKAREVVGAS